MKFFIYLLIVFCSFLQVQAFAFSRMSTSQNQVPPASEKAVSPYQCTGEFTMSPAGKGHKCKNVSVYAIHESHSCRMKADCEKDNGTINYGTEITAQVISWGQTHGNSAGDPFKNLRNCDGVLKIVDACNVVSSKW